MESLQIQPGQGALLARYQPGVMPTVHFAHATGGAASSPWAANHLFMHALQLQDVDKIAAAWKDTKQGGAQAQVIQLLHDKKIPFVALGLFGVAGTGSLATITYPSVIL